MSHRRMDKLGLYAKLGVPEFWRFAPERLRAFTLMDGVYAAIDVSIVVFGLPIRELARFLERRLESNRRAVSRLAGLGNACYHISGENRLTQA